jgi:ribonuclease HI
VVKKFNPKKAPGEDGLTSGIILQVFRSFPSFLTEEYNKCLKDGCFPKQWKRSSIIPIIKPGKEDKVDASKYQPISLLNVAGKVLDKLMIDRILHHVHSTAGLNTHQYGFTPKRGTVDAAMTVKAITEENLGQNNCTSVVSLDVRGAFDAAWWPSILCNLKELKCPKNLYNLSRSYFSNRTASLHGNTMKIEKPVTVGCPQGSCSGPGFWNILYNSPLNMEFTHHTRVIAFANDLMVLTRDKSALEAENYANQDLKRIENWARNNKMQFNEHKSKVLLVTGKKSEANATLNIYFNNKRLEQVSDLKYLGIYFDSRFSFDRHVNYITGKCTSIIHMLAKSAKLKWGLRHRALKVIYSGAIEPTLTYGAPIFEKALTKQNNLRKYQSVKRIMNIKIARAFSTLSYEASCVLAGVRPIWLVIEEKAQNYKATHNNNEFDAPLEVKHWPHPAEIPSLKAPIEIPLNVINIFTDGSKIRGKVGAAAVIIKDDIVLHKSKYKLHDRCSNNQAEQVAIQKALEQLQHLLLTDDTAKIVVVNTDSKVALDTVRNRKKHYILIENIRRQIKRLEDLQWTVIFNWVKAHAGT